MRLDFSSIPERKWGMVEWEPNTQVFCNLVSFMDLIGFPGRQTMVRPKLTITLSWLLVSCAGCHSASPSWASHPTSRYEDPLLCTDVERKRGADLYATTSQARYNEPAPGVASR